MCKKKGIFSVEVCTLVEGVDSVKASVHDSIKTLADVQSGFFGWVIPHGTIGTVVECYQQPKEGYAVDVAIPDQNRDGELFYDNVILFPDQFEVVSVGQGQQMATAKNRSDEERLPKALLKGQSPS